MEAFVPDDRCQRLDAFESRLRGVLGVREIGRDVYAPVREGCPHGFEPFPDACFASMNLLTSADQTDHDRPRVMPVEIGDQELRLRAIEVRDLLPPTHEVRSLRLRPGSLRLVEDDNMIV